jgi:hypothetical protein
MNPELRERVLVVYAAVDAVVAAAAPRCDASGRCCRFTEYGHTLFLSQFEADILLESAPPFARPVTRDGCPFQVDNLCTAHHERPLGCRIYFCDSAFQEPQQDITEWAVAELKKLADEFGTGWRYAPLHVFLNDSSRPQDGEASNADPPAPSRMSLPVV